MATIDKVKMGLRISTNAFDNELTDLIAAAQTDLGIAGVVLPDTLDEISITAIITYCKLRFGLPENPEWLKKSYDEQKAQLVTATGYTDWGDD